MEYQEIVTNGIAVIIVLITLAKTRLVFIGKIILCGITTYWIFSNHYSDFRVWSIAEYTEQNLKEFPKSRYFSHFILITSAIYLTLYGFLKFILRSTLEKSLEKFYDKKFQKVFGTNPRTFEAFVLRFSRRVFRYKIPKFIFSNIAKELNADEIKKEIHDIFYNALIIVVHFSSCWFILDFYLNLPMYILIVSVVLFLTIETIAIPAVKYYMNGMLKVINHEFNRN